jgi:hypothetical protein
MTVMQLLRHDRSLTAWLGWLVPGVILFSIGIVSTVGGYGAYESRRYRVSYRDNEALSATAFGTVLVIKIANMRTAKPCEGAYVDRRLVRYYPGTHRVMLAMPIRERGIANDDLGERNFSLVVNISAPIEPGAGWIYQSKQHDNCGFWQSIFQDDGGWIGQLVADFQQGRDMPAPDTPVIVSSSPPPVPGVAFKALDAVPVSVPAWH